MKRTIAMGLASLLALFALLVGPPPAESTTLLPQPVQTIIQEVPVPGPVETIIKEVKVPGPVETVIKRVPGPVRTVFVPGPERTVFVPGPTRTVFEPGPVRTVFVPVGQTPEPDATISSEAPQPAPTPPPPEVVVVVSPSPVAGSEKVVEREVVVTVPQAIGISVGLVAAGIILGLLALFLVYTLGFKEAERKEIKSLRDLADELYGK